VFNTLIGKLVLAELDDADHGVHLHILGDLVHVLVTDVLAREVDHAVGPILEGNRDGGLFARSLCWAFQHAGRWFKPTSPRGDHRISYLLLLLLLLINAACFNFKQL
jgi:hypothetical protein